MALVWTHLHSEAGHLWGGRYGLFFWNYVVFLPSCNWGSLGDGWAWGGGAQEFQVYGSCFSGCLDLPSL